MKEIIDNIILFSNATIIIVTGIMVADILRHIKIYLKALAKKKEAESEQLQSVAELNRKKAKIESGNKQNWDLVLTEILPYIKNLFNPPGE